MPQYSIKEERIINSNKYGMECPKKTWKETITKDMLYLNIIDYMYFN